MIETHSRIDRIKEWFTNYHWGLYTVLSGILINLYYAFTEVPIQYILILITVEYGFFGMFLKQRYYNSEKKHD